MDTNNCINVPCDRYFSSLLSTRDTPDIFTGKDRGKNWTAANSNPDHVIASRAATVRLGISRSRDRVAPAMSAMTWESMALTHCRAISTYAHCTLVIKARGTRASSLVSFSLASQPPNRTYRSGAPCPTSPRTKSVSEMNEWCENFERTANAIRTRVRTRRGTTQTRYSWTANELSRSMRIVAWFAACNWSILYPVFLSMPWKFLYM